MSATESPSSSRASAREGRGTPRVAFFSAEWCAAPVINLGGSDYWRVALPASKLFENGWDVIFARNLAEGPDGRIRCEDSSGQWRDDRDVIVVQRWMAKGTAERFRRAREAGQVIINEVDDDYWNFPEIHVASRSSSPEHNPDANREHYKEIVAASSLVTVSTASLARELADSGPPVRLVRNYIDTAWWTPCAPGDYIGWVGGLPWRGHDVELLRETVIPWMRDRGSFFYHGGSIADMPIEDRIGYDRVTTRPLANILDYPKLWEPLRVALIPMEDTTFNRSKSWVKGLEACARRIPFIHSPHAEYDELGVGLCAREPEDWVRHLEALSDPGFYAEQCAANRARAEQLDIDDHWAEWANVLQEAVQISS